MHDQPPRPALGFTLIEIMITVVIVGILASIVYPSFLQQIRKGRRSDAVEVLARVMQAQERWRGENPLYGTLANIGVTSPSSGGYYSFTLSNNNATSYTLQLTGVGSQASDTGCSTLTVTVTGGNAAYSQPSCWSR